VAKVVLDKNPKQVLDDDLRQMKEKFSGKNPNTILSSNPFLKSEFLNRLIDSDDIPVIFLDFDLLYSGYVVSGMIKKRESVRILRSDRISWEKQLQEIIKEISKQKVLVILDSLNGIYNMFDELESSRFTSAAIMLLSYVARHTKSSIVVTAMAVKNNVGEWVLSPGGRHLMDSKKSGMFYLDLSEKRLILNSIDKRP